MPTKSLLIQTDGIVHSAQGKLLGIFDILIKTILWRTRRINVSPFLYCHCIQLTTANWLSAFLSSLPQPQVSFANRKMGRKWMQFIFPKFYPFNWHTDLCKHTYKWCVSCHLFRRDNYLCLAMMYLLLLWRQLLYRQTPTCFHKNENFYLRACVIMKWA